VSELDVPLLVRRTRLLLRAYPPAYREHRGEEILDTLLETTRPGRGWPPAREVVSVAAGGLRARRAANLSQGLAASLRHIGILAAALLMVAIPSQLLSFAGLFAGRLLGGDEQWSHGAVSLVGRMALAGIPGSILAVLALWAAWRGRRWLVAATVVPAVLAAVVCASLLGAHSSSRFVPGFDLSVPGFDLGDTILFLALSGVPALVVLVPLTRRTERPPASLLWLPCMPLMVSLGFGSKLDTLLPVNGIWLTLAAPYITYVSLATVAVAVCWLVTDVRPLAAVVVDFLLERVIDSCVAFHGHYLQGAGQTAIVIGVSLVLTCALVWLLRHLARAAQPTIG
jgi:hypothetical protein